MCSRFVWSASFTANLPEFLAIEWPYTNRVYLWIYETMKLCIYKIKRSWCSAKNILVNFKSHSLESKLVRLMWTSANREQDLYIKMQVTIITRPETLICTKLQIYTMKLAPWISTRNLKECEPEGSIGCNIQYWTLRRHSHLIQFRHRMFSSVKWSLDSALAFRLLVSQSKITTIRPQNHDDVNSMIIILHHTAKTWKKKCTYLVIDIYPYRHNLLPIFKKNTLSCHNSN